MLCFGQLRPWLILGVFALLNSQSLYRQTSIHYFIWPLLTLQLIHMQPLPTYVSPSKLSRPTHFAKAAIPTLAEAVPHFVPCKLSCLTLPWVEVLLVRYLYALMVSLFPVLSFLSGLRILLQLLGLMDPYPISYMWEVPMLHYMLFLLSLAHFAYPSLLPQVSILGCV